MTIFRNVVMIIGFEEFQYILSMLYMYYIAIQLECMLVNNTWSIITVQLYQPYPYL